jgi:hypothetical protein
MNGHDDSHWEVEQESDAVLKQVADAVSVDRSVGAVRGELIGVVEHNDKAVLRRCRRDQVSEELAALVRTRLGIEALGCLRPVERVSDRDGSATDGPRVRGDGSVVFFACRGSPRQCGGVDACKAFLTAQRINHEVGEGRLGDQAVRILAAAEHECFKRRR